MVWSNQAPTSLTFPPGATTGQRITIDQNGLLGFDSANHLIFAITSLTNTQLEAQYDCSEAPVVITTNGYYPTGTVEFLNTNDNIPPSIASQSSATTPIIQMITGDGPDKNGGTNYNSSLTLSPYNVGSGLEYSILNLNNSYVPGPGWLIGLGQQYSPLSVSSQQDGISKFQFGQNGNAGGIFNFSGTFSGSLPTTAHSFAPNVTTINIVSDYTAPIWQAPGIFIPPADGFYDINFNIRFNALITNGQVSCGVVSNLPSIANAFGGSAGAGSTIMSSGSMYLTTTDRLYFLINNQTTTNFTIIANAGGGGSYLSICRRLGS